MHGEVSLLTARAMSALRVVEKGSDREGVKRDQREREGRGASGLLAASR